MREELGELKTRIEETETRKNSVDEQLELMEKPFQMAAKYMPQNVGTTSMVGITGTTGTGAVTDHHVAETAPATKGVSGKTAVALVSQVWERTVSALLPEMSDAEFIEAYGKPRNMGFLTATGEADSGQKIRFGLHIRQPNRHGRSKNVHLRLLEPIRAGNSVIPRNTLLVGTARIQGERLTVNIVSLEHAGNIIPVGLRVYDLGGQSGSFIPNMAELKATKEIVANMGTSAGTSITLSNDAGQQFAADMGRNVIQGVSQFTAKKLREVKVHLKADYKVFFIENSATASNFEYCFSCIPYLKPLCIAFSPKTVYHLPEQSFAKRIS